MCAAAEVNFQNGDLRKVSFLLKIRVIGEWNIRAKERRWAERRREEAEIYSIGLHPHLVVRRGWLFPSSWGHGGGRETFVAEFNGVYYPLVGPARHIPDAPIALALFIRSINPSYPSGRVASNSTIGRVLTYFTLRIMSLCAGEGTTRSPILTFWNITITKSYLIIISFTLK